MYKQIWTLLYCCTFASLIINQVYDCQAWRSPVNSVWFLERNLTVLLIPWLFCNNEFYWTNSASLFLKMFILYFYHSVVVISFIVKFICCLLSRVFPVNSWYRPGWCEHCWLRASERSPACEHCWPRGSGYGPACEQCWPRVSECSPQSQLFSMALGLIFSRDKSERSNLLIIPNSSVHDCSHADCECVWQNEKKYKQFTIKPWHNAFRSQWE